MKKENSKERRDRILFSLVSFAMCLAVIFSFIFMTTDILDEKGIMEYEKEKDCVCVRFGTFSDVPHALRYDLDKDIVEYAKSHERTVVVCQIKRFRIPTGEFLGLNFGSSSYEIEKITITDESPDDFHFF